jgi:hypothetical protein
MQECDLATSPIANASEVLANARVPETLVVKTSG